MVRILSMLCGAVFISVAVSAAGSDAATAELIQALGLKQSPQASREATYWQKPRRIVLVMEARQRESRPDAVDWLKQVAGDAEFVVAPNRKAAADLLDGADVLLGYCTHETLNKGKQLRYILNYSAGVDRCMSSPLIRERDLLVTNMQRIYGPGIAEHAIAMMLSLIHI